MKETLCCGYRFPFAYVAFGGQRTHWWTWFLKRGFYHCVLILGNGAEWVVIDPVVHYTDLILLKNADIYLDMLTDSGHQAFFPAKGLPARPDDAARADGYPVAPDALHLRGSRQTLFGHSSAFFDHALSAFSLFVVKIGK